MWQQLIAHLFTIGTLVVAIYSLINSRRQIEIAIKQVEVANKQITIAKELSSATAVADLVKMYFSEDMHKHVTRLSKLARYWRSVGKNSGDVNKVVPRTVDGNEVSKGCVLESSDKISLMSLYNDGSSAVYPWTNKDDLARRGLKSYFATAYSLYHQKLISDNAFKDLCSADSVNLYFTVVEPMEAIKNADYTKDPFYEIMKILGEVYTEKYENNLSAHSQPTKYLADNYQSVQQDIDEFANVESHDNDKVILIPTKAYLLRLKTSGAVGKLNAGTAAITGETVNPGVTV